MVVTLIYVTTHKYSTGQSSVVNNVHSRAYIVELFETRGDAPCGLFSSVDLKRRALNGVPVPGVRSMFRASGKWT